MKYTGVVLEGKRRGSELGYPTANIAMEGSEADSSRPEHAQADVSRSEHAKADGIYAAIVTIGGTAMHAAAFADPTRGVLEVHILDFFHDLYGQEISVELKKKMRDTEDFASDAELRTAIAEDINAVRQHFSAE
jgi:riboflavin kinase/FMN adenylyltransferase